MGTSSSRQLPVDPTKQQTRLVSESTDPIKRDSRKSSRLARMQDQALGAGTRYSDEDLKKYTGKSNDEMKTFMENTPGVGKNQRAGKIGMGPGTGGAGAIGSE